MRIVFALAAALLISCGTTELSRYQDTADGDGPDPFGLCAHVEEELVNACTAEELDQVACLQECVDAGGQDVAPFSAFDGCVHESSNDGSCAAQTACLQVLGATCVTGTSTR